MLILAEVQAPLPLFPHGRSSLPREPLPGTSGRSFAPLEAQSRDSTEASHASAASKSSRCAEPSVKSLPEARRLCFSIASGRRHCAVATFAEEVFAWGRDVALPAQPPPEIRGLDLLQAWRTSSQARAATCDRPRCLRFRGSPTQPQNFLSRHGEVLFATPSATSLRLPDGRLVLTGGWPSEDLAEGGHGARRRFSGPISEALRDGLPTLRQVARGFCFNVALSEDGQVFVWRHSGLFPTGSTERVPRDPYSALPADVVAVDVAVGEGHVVVLTSTGQVWSFGWQCRSALGRGNSLTLACAGSPARIPGLKDIVQIGAGATYSIALDVRGVLWMFGEGPCMAGAFGDPSAFHEPKPAPSSAFGGHRVLAAACGDGHVLVLTAWDPQGVLVQPGSWVIERALVRPGEDDPSSNVVIAEFPREHRRSD